MKINEILGAWYENKDWYHKHGISKKDYNLLVKYSSDDKVNEAHFEDDQVELETNPVDHDQDDLLAFCKKRGIKVEKRGAHNLVRFSGKKEDLRDMINQFWGEPAHYLSQIKEEKEAYTGQGCRNS